MRQVNIHEAKTHLSKLIADGEEVVIARYMVRMICTGVQRVHGKWRSNWLWIDFHCPILRQYFCRLNLGKNRIESLPIVDTHAFQAALLPRHQRDPFDRMLVAQAQVETLGLISNDPKISLYNVNVYWKE